MLLSVIRLIQVAVSTLLLLVFQIEMLVKPLAPGGGAGVRAVSLRRHSPLAQSLLVRRDAGLLVDLSVPSPLVAWPGLFK